MTKFVQALVATETDKGASLVEYALLVALIAAVCIFVITRLGNSIEGQFSVVSNAVGA